MNSIPETGRPFALLNYETFAFWAYTAGVATTAFGPIAHYIGWTFALASLIYGKLRYNASLSVKLGSGSKRIMIFLVLFLIWSMFAHIPYVDSFYVWGKGASIPLEFLTGLYLAMRLINNSERRNIFGLAVVAVNVVFCFDVMFRPEFHILGWNGSLDNGNAVAIYSLLLMPIFCCYALWYFENNILLKYFLCLTSFLLVFFSFSSGGWITGVFQTILLLHYAVNRKKINLKHLSCFVIIITALLIILTHNLGPTFQENIKREIKQLTAFDDPQVMTTDRVDTWKAGIFLSMKHPIAGGGWANFESEFKKNHEYMRRHINYQRRGGLSQPHSMYISILYAGGVASLLFFVCAVVFSIIKSWAGLKYNLDEGAVPWSLICLVLLSSQLIYGTNGDIFEARRDVSVIFWACWGLLLAIPDYAELSDKGDNIEDPALC